MRHTLARASSPVKPSLPLEVVAPLVSASAWVMVAIFLQACMGGRPSLHAYMSSWHGMCQERIVVCVCSCVGSRVLPCTCCILLVACWRMQKVRAGFRCTRLCIPCPCVHVPCVRMHVVVSGDGMPRFRSPRITLRVFCKELQRSCYKLIYTRMIHMIKPVHVLLFL